jgi:formylglycine-generating enzyme required for sulfatase activity
MGSRPSLDIAEEPQHQVTLTRGFWIAIAPVTQQLWQAVTGKMFRGAPGSEKLPVDGVSWDIAVEFCEQIALVLRQAGHLESQERICLPTEAQWEYACRAGSDSQWFFGDKQEELAKYAWYRENSGEQPHAAALKKANMWGLYDSYGNVAEWCADCFYAYEANETVDPLYQHDNDLRIVRGGSYADDAMTCRSASRACVLRENPYTQEIGLRLVCMET